MNHEAIRKAKLVQIMDRHRHVFDSDVRYEAVFVGIYNATRKYTLGCQCGWMRVWYEIVDIGAFTAETIAGLCS